MITDLDDSQETFRAAQNKRKVTFTSSQDAFNAAFQYGQQKRKATFESTNKDWNKKISQQVKSVEKLQTEVIALRQAFKKSSEQQENSVEKLHKESALKVREME
jgi:hypothetical protein